MRIGFLYNLLRGLPRSLARGGTALFACVFAAEAQAQSPPVQLDEIVVAGAGTGTTPLKTASLNLTVPTTAGSRLNLTPLQTPASVSVIPGEQIRRQGDQTINQAESRAVGVTAVPFSGNGNNSLSARGFYGPNSIAQLYDGMQLFNAGGVVVFPFDPWNVDRIDVLAGSSSVLYGTGGVGGALNVIPREPDPVAQHTAFQGSVGSFRTLHSALDTTGPINPHLSYRFDISQYNSAGWVRPEGDSRSLAMSGALRFAPGEDFVVTLRDDYGNINPSVYEGTPKLGGDAFRPLRFTNYNVSDGYIVFRENHVNLKEEWIVNDHLSFVNDSYLVTQYRRYHEGSSFTYDPATSSVTRTLFRDISAVQNQLGDHGFARIISRPLGFANETIVGFDANRSVYNRSDNQTGGSQGSSTVNAFNFLPGTFASTGATLATPQYVLDLKQAGVFTENRLSLTEQIAFIAGLRYDRYTTDLVTFPSLTRSAGAYEGLGYHFGLIYNPLPTSALYARYSVSTDPVTSLASVNASQIAFGLSPARQIEIGAKQTAFANRLEGTIALYRIVKNNLLTPSLDNPSVFDTVGQQSSRGIEGSLSYRLTDGIRLEANGTILAAKFDSFLAASGGGVVDLAGFRPQFVPTKAANILAYWTFLPHWELRGALRYVGDRFSDNTDLYKLKGYAVIDVGLRWDATRNVSFDLRANNVTDRIYPLSTYAGNSTQFILGDPRSVTGTLNVQF